MDFDEAIAELPAKYAQALRLRGDGLSGAHIAELLEIPADSIDPLLQLAEAKLAALRPPPPTAEETAEPTRSSESARSEGPCDPVGER